MYTDTVKELQGYPVQNCLSGSFLTNPIVVSHLSFNFLRLLLLYIIYLGGFDHYFEKYELERAGHEVSTLLYLSASFRPLS